MSEAKASSYYVRRERDGREGWVGPIRSVRQAEKEVAAWASCGWGAELHPSSPAIKKAVREWQKRVQAERVAVAR